jgi:quercetin dioxygenase-like cupin family protein
VKHVVIKDLPSKELAPGVVMRSAYLNNVMVTFVDLADGSVVPVHSHPHEQMSVMIEGSLLFTVAGEDKLVHAGEVVLVPSGVEHGVKAVAGKAVAYDCWSPIREDYILDR